MLRDEAAAAAVSDNGAGTRGDVGSDAHRAAVDADVEKERVLLRLVHGRSLTGINIVHNGS